MVINIKLVQLFVFFLILSPSVWADEACPNGADLIYCKVSQETGGKIYNGHSENILKNIQEDNKKSIEQLEINNKHVHKYSPYSKDIGCNEWTDDRSHEICESISKNLEWGWTGHAAIAPSWRVNNNTIKNVYCDKKISSTDLPILEKMCGSEVYPYMSCIKPIDSRFAVGVESLIKIILAQNKMSDEFKETIYEPQGKKYILTGGCKK